MNIITKFSELLQITASPHYFAFFPGHWYLDERQLENLLMNLSDGISEDDLVLDYEINFAGLVGSGQCISFAAGRMAFYQLLKALGIGRGDEVILPGFTCSVMANAVWRTGATPVYSDIDLETFGSDAEAIERKISDKTKLIVAQHSFGIPCKIDEIVELGSKRNIFVLEDCALTLDSSYKGVKVGNWGDAAMFSTDHSKPINTLTGGMLYTKNIGLFRKVKDEMKDVPHLDREQQESLIRVFHAERMHCSPDRYARSKLSRSISSYANRLFAGISKSRKAVFLDCDNGACRKVSYPYPARLPPFAAQLGLWELERWPQEKKRRRKLLAAYLETMRSAGLDDIIPAGYMDSDNHIVPLRFAFLSNRPEVVKQRLKRFVDINWIWFREPIINCSEGPAEFGYEYGNCPIAEKANRTIINYPCIVAEEWEGPLLRLFDNVFATE